jgi:hypothetical protein
VSAAHRTPAPNRAVARLSSAGEAPAAGRGLAARSSRRVRRPSSVALGTRRRNTAAITTVAISRATRKPTGRPLALPAATRATPRASRGTNHSTAARQRARCSGVGASPPRRSRSRTAARAGACSRAAWTSLSRRLGLAATCWYMAHSTGWACGPGAVPATSRAGWLRRRLELVRPPFLSRLDTAVVATRAPPPLSSASSYRSRRAGTAAPSPASIHRRVRTTPSTVTANRTR